MIKAKIKIKPLSVNKAWQGKRYKTNDYKRFERDLLILLPAKKLEDRKNLSLYLKVGFSSKNSDLSNVLKLAEDILQKKYEFNDKNIFKIVMVKEIVPKGEEYLDFELEVLTKEGLEGNKKECACQYETASKLFGASVIHNGNCPVWKF